MLLEQHYLNCLSQASYLIADEHSKDAVVVDPRRDVDIYLEAARKHGLNIKYVMLTHLHADFLAGHLELRERTGAEICIGAGVTTEYASRSLADGDVISLGAVNLEIMATPGHTPESISILVHAAESPPASPHAVLTGDTLFIGDVGRPDLMASVGITANELAERLHESLHGKLMKLPDETLVYPAHGAGSLCGKGLSSETVSTIGDQRKLNYALQPMSRVDFVTMITQEQPPAPVYFSYDAVLNRREHATLDESLARALKPLPVEDVVRQMNAGAVALDVRNHETFIRGHLKGSVNVGIEGRFATWAGTVIKPGTLIVILADPGREREAAMRLGRIGYDAVLGFLAGGFDALAARPDLTSDLRRFDLDVAAELLDTATPPLLVDVRGCGEYRDGHIPGSVNMPLDALQDRLDEIPRDRDLLLHCKSGYRSSMAMSILESAGFAALTDIRDGYDGWKSSGRPTT